MCHVKNPAVDPWTWAPVPFLPQQSMGQSLPKCRPQCPHLWNKVMGREVHEVAFSFISLSLCLTKWRKNCSQSVGCHDFVSKPRLTPLKCPALGWEWLAHCLPEESMPEPESPPLGHMRAVFSKLFATEKVWIWILFKIIKELKRLLIMWGQKPCQHLTCAWVFAVCRMEESQEMVQRAVVLVGEGVETLWPSVASFTLRPHLTSLALQLVPQLPAH